MKKKTKQIISIIIIFFCVMGIWLALPFNYHIRKAAVHLMPKIDQYPIFENRVIKAGSPQAWKLSDYYNKNSIPEKYAEDFDKLGTVAYVIIQNGELLFEQYWDNYSHQSHSNSFSIAKSIVSLAVGCAIDDGFIRDVDQPVGDFFAQFKGYHGKTLTLRHLLTMSAGLDFQESYSSVFSPTTQLYYGNNLNNITFGMKEIEEPGIHFIYQSGVTQLLAYIIKKATGENLCSFVSRRIWTPLQAEEDAWWSLDRKGGMEKAYCCFNSNARDFARLGQLVLNNGKWNGKQIISEQYIREAITADSCLIDKEHNEINRHYGFQFWTLKKNGMSIPYMRGIMGQYIFVVPEKNAVVVRLGHKRSDTYTEKQHYPADIDTWLDAAIEILDKTPKQARLVFSGDLMQHYPQVYAAQDSRGGYDYSMSFQYVKPIFEQADLAFVNLETTLTASACYTGYPLFRSPKELAGALYSAGIDVAVMANNHAFDGGKQGVYATLSLLDSANIKHTGVFAGCNDFIKRHPLMLQIKNIQIALLNYTYGTNGLPTPDGLSINRIDSFTIAHDIAQIDRSRTDAIIVFFHWGNEYSRQSNSEQKSLAELCHRYGAEIVIGSHPHVVQPVSFNKEEDGSVNNITVYSLGNLVSNQRERYKDGGIIVALDLVKEKNKRLKIIPSYTPVWVQLPKYKILPPAVADTIPMSDDERIAYERFIKDTNDLLSGKKE
ncbi:MAG: CapA family protein [Tannerella sp.]|jgi:CubicO group peptidase (beta-lactamase class C family)|nr:CapA family protein [Tannerella sp.]